jgi:hypothetical protein
VRPRAVLGARAAIDLLAREGCTGCWERAGGTARSKVVQPAAFGRRRQIEESYRALRTSCRWLRPFGARERAVSLNPPSGNEAGFAVKGKQDASNRGCSFTIKLDGRP